LQTSDFLRFLLLMLSGLSLGLNTMLKSVVAFVFFVVFIYFCVRVDCPNKGTQMPYSCISGWWIYGNRRKPADACLSGLDPKKWIYVNGHKPDRTMPKWVGPKFDMKQMQLFRRLVANNIFVTSPRMW